MENRCISIWGFPAGNRPLGLDAVPIEGIDREVLNQELQLSAKGLTSVALVAVGYKAETDFNAQLPKSRFAADRIMSFI